jgi:hypothetical protein
MSTFEKILIVFGALSLILLPYSFYSDYKKHLYIEELVLKSYEIEEKILNMSDENDEFFRSLNLHDTYSWYEYEDFSRAYDEYNRIARNISGIGN